MAKVKSRLLRLGSTGGASLEPLPLVSPSQRPTGPEKNLHSIFSPMANDRFSATSPTTPATVYNRRSGVAVPKSKSPHSSWPLPPTSVTKAESMKTPSSHRSALVEPSPSDGGSVMSSLVGLRSPFSYTSRGSVDSQLSIKRSPYKGLPDIGMINYEYILECQSSEELRQIVRVLQSEGMPSLLQAAEQRYQVVVWNQELSSGQRSHGKVMKENLIPRHAIVPNSSSKRSREPPQVRFVESVVHAGLEHRNDINISQSLNMSLSTDSASEIDDLSNMELVSVRNKLEPTSSAGTVTHAKECQREDQLSGENVGKREFEEHLAQINAQNCEIQALLDSERTNHAISRDRIKELEVQLKAKVEEILQSRISFDEKDAELRKLLLETQAELKSVKQERDNMIQQLVGAMDPCKVKACENMESTQVVREFVEEAKLTEQSHKELAMRTAKVEMDRDHIREKKEKLRLKLQQTTESKAKAEVSNAKLALQLEHLTSELLQSRTELETATKDSHIRGIRHHVERDSIYKGTIRSLKDKVHELESHQAPRLSNLGARGLNRKTAPSKPAKAVRIADTPAKARAPQTYKTPMRNVTNSAVSTIDLAPKAPCVPFATLKSQRVSRNLRSPPSPRAQLSPKAKPSAPKRPPPPKHFKFSPVPPSTNGGRAKVRMRRINVTPAPPLAIDTSKTNFSMDGASFSPVARNMGRAQVRANRIKRCGSPFKKRIPPPPPNQQ